MNQVKMTGDDEAVTLSLVIENDEIASNNLSQSFFLLLGSILIFEVYHA